MTTISKADLDKVFGPESSGQSPPERALTSQRQFVRGQTMLAEASPEATGRRLAAVEALNIFDFPTLLKAAEEGQVLIVRERTEPAKTLRRYREALGYTQQHLARLAKVSVNDVVKAETPGKISSIRNLERLARPLAIDERILGFKNQPGGEELGVRLRQLANATGMGGLTKSAVAALAEGAWIIARQRSLSLQLSEFQSDVLERFQPDNDYGFPTYKRGYQLAAKTRDLLNLNSEAPIRSMRRLVSDTLGIPLVQTKMGSGFAGATIANGTDRGIVVNLDGANENVWVRRMTLAHELAHLLWDPAQKLKRLMIDRYDDLVVNRTTPRDVVEIRANAFAIAFLAPPAAVDRMVHQAVDVPTAVFEVARHFGISVTAAAHHVENVSGVHVVMPNLVPRPEPLDEMRALEDFTVDYFPIKNVPPAVVGRFSWVVARALRSKLISQDTAAAFLCTTPDKLDEETVTNVLNLADSL